MVSSIHVHAYNTTLGLLLVDLLIHLGDLEGSEGYLETIAPCPVEMVAGNNDFFSRLPREKVITLGSRKVLLTHGHNHYVNYGYDRLREAARQNGCDYAFFGHIHRPVYETDEGITVVNPGSISLPRQDNKRPSYAVLDIDRKGEIQIMIGYI